MWYSWNIQAFHWVFTFMIFFSFNFCLCFSIFLFLLSFLPTFFPSPPYSLSLILSFSFWNFFEPRWGMDSSVIIIFESVKLHKCLGGIAGVCVSECVCVCVCVHAVKYALIERKTSVVVCKHYKDLLPPAPYSQIVYSGSSCLFIIQLHTGCWETFIIHYWIVLMSLPPLKRTVMFINFVYFISVKLEIKKWCKIAFIWPPYLEFETVNNFFKI